MAILTGNWLFDIVSIFIALIAVFLAWIKWSQGYWQRRGVLTPPVSFLFGNTRTVLAQTESFGEFCIGLYNDLRKLNQPHGGCYFMFMPTYVPVDPDIIKRIMQNDFNHFVDRGVYYNETNDPLSAHLFSIEGAKWRNLRVKLTPTFTSGKMKMMFETLVKCSDQLVVEMDRIMKQGPVDIKNILARFTTDIIGTCAFGIDCNSLKNPDNEFSRYQKLFLTGTFWDNIKGFFSFIMPDVCRKFGLKVVNETLAKFFMRIITETVEYREKNNIKQKDFMHLLLQLKNKGKLVDDHEETELDSKEDVKPVSLTLNELAAQAFVFFLAGFETSSTTMTFCLYELASNVEIQEKVRQEVNEVLKRHDNKLTYEAIMEMHYMEKVVNETLRKYPPLPLLQRVCTKEYKVPGTDLVIEEGTKVIIPVLGLQRDDQYYPNPEKFDPERFSEDCKKDRHPYTFLPFGEGPRICIGLRFGMMQTKVGLSVLLRNYKFKISSKTVIPLKLDPNSFILATEGGMWLDYTKI